MLLLYNEIPVSHKRKKYCHLPKQKESGGYDAIWDKLQILLARSQHWYEVPWGIFTCSPMGLSWKLCRFWPPYESNYKARPKDHLASASGTQKPRSSPWRHDTHMGFPVALLPTHSASSNRIYKLCIPPNTGVLQLQEFRTVLSSQHKLASVKTLHSILAGPSLPVSFWFTRAISLSFWLRRGWNPSF